MHTIMQQLRYYLAVQDGRYDNEEYDTEEEAIEALGAIPEFDRRGVCVMSYWKVTK